VCATLRDEHHLLFDAARGTARWVLVD